MLTRAMLKKINAQSTCIIVSLLQANGGSLYKDTAWLQRVAARSKLGIGRKGGDPTGILAHLVTAKSSRDP
eukprot:CAMPEP_0119388586 /NCGR_PEP_ID=MMETSP1334-20130426/105664_1 /TAXON_ID=127549 /ORGANISM="Calcidiscus leptoporus, Strain RCC1130" /LENGTH=70 /DNA_ID=CAMNT_0007410623 /DNA_START=173 /DNA_END=382 /DNA_ORIENTATION=+